METGKKENDVNRLLWTLHVQYGITFLEAGN
jgi:hypothetical protein